MNSERASLFGKFTSEAKQTTFSATAVCPSSTVFQAQSILYYRCEQLYCVLRQYSLELELVALVFRTMI